MGKYLGSTGLAYLWGKIKSALGVKEDKATIVNHGTSSTTFALTPNVLHVWGTINSLTLSLVTDTDNYVDGYWFKFTADSSFTALTLPTGVNWVIEPEIEAGKTYEVMIVDGLASYVTDGIGDTVKAKTRIVNHGTSDTTYQLAPNEFHIWGEVASLTLTLKDESTGFVDGYWFRFTCGSTPTVLTLPSSVEWYYEEVEFEANHTYEVTIVEGKACYTDYASTTQIATKQWVETYVQQNAGDVNISTQNGSTLNAAVNTIYTYSAAVTSLAITLPAITDSTKAEAISFILTTGTSPNITFSSTNSATILYHDGFEFEDSTMYEVNAMFVGSSWIIGLCKINNE